MLRAVHNEELRAKTTSLTGLIEEPMTYGPVTLHTKPLDRNMTSGVPVNSAKGEREKFIRTKPQANQKGRSPSQLQAPI